MSTKVPLADLLAHAPELAEPVPVASRCVVRLRTTMWRDGKGLYLRKSLLFMRRLSIAGNLLEEDASNVGVEAILPRIVNLNACDDGLYTVVVCNEARDWESGHVEDYDYTLVPFAEDSDWLSTQAKTP